jgi:geranylgeranyl reductase family protein
MSPWQFANRLGMLVQRQHTSVCNNVPFRRIAAMDCTVSLLARQALPMAIPPNTADVTVIGAGPAGALLAYLLAVHGMQVLLVDKASLPRIKPCGGGLNQKTVDLLPLAITPVVQRVVQRVVFTYKLRLPFGRTYPEPLVTMVTRCHFDYFLVQQAARLGVKVYDDCRVTQIEEARHFFVLRANGRAWRSRYIAFADGAKGTLRRQLGFPATAPHDLGLDMDVESGLACPWTSDTLYIDWGAWPLCYAWAFPKADHWSIGVKGPAAQSRLLVAYLRQFMHHWRLGPPEEKLHYLAHMLPTRHAGMPLVRGRALVLGDAAGLLEPFTGEGIYYALRSAHCAAAALREASPSNASPTAYAAAVEAEIMPELIGARGLQQLFDAYPWLFHLLIRSRQKYWHALARILRGERGFADVQRVLQRHPYLVRVLLRGWGGQ